MVLAPTRERCDPRFPHALDADPVPLQCCAIITVRKEISNRQQFFELMRIWGKTACHRVFHGQGSSRAGRVEHREIDSARVERLIIGA
ncbi:hypothetical protein DB31_0421 [Hyalangium minutum]|uniref:Uncharacterized protein n=1 Tax=Hyalangium minutum TaxID=394096 RepID=A0A085WWU7_9BACT|nr:hypothetical protein DB31_0421 [Hyalangium minutum]